MIVFSSKEALSGGKSPKKVRKLTADTVEEWTRLVRTALALENKEGWWAQWPSKDRPWSFKRKEQVVLWCRVELMPQLVTACDAVQVPEGYWQLCAGVLQRDMWKLWSQHERDQDPAWEYWRRKIKWLAGQVFRGGWYVRDPESWDGGDIVGGIMFSESGAVRAVKTWNAWIEKFDLAQRRRVNTTLYRSNVAKQEVVILGAGIRSDQVQRKVVIPEERLAYFQMTDAEKAVLAEERKWYVPMWRAWEEEYQGGKVIPEIGIVVWLKAGAAQPKTE